jgi:transposase
MLFQSLNGKSKTIQELEAKVGELSVETDSLKTKVGELSEENGRLKAKLDEPRKDSENSSISPNKGRYPHKTEQKLDEHGNPINGRAGAKKGHKAYHRKKAKGNTKNKRNSKNKAASNEVVPEVPAEQVPVVEINTAPDSTQCPHCGTEMEPCKKRDNHHEQFELIDNPVILKKFTQAAFQCPDCKQVVHGEKPKEALTGFFGPALIAWLLYVKGMGHVSITGLQRLLSVFGLNVCRGVICKYLDKGSEALKGAYEEVKAALPSQAVLNVDETGHREQGKRLWTWVFRAKTFAFFSIKVDRASSVLVELLGKAFKGFICCDYFSAYKKFVRMLPSGLKVQFCLAHLKRDLTFLQQHLSEPALSQYGQKLLDILSGVFEKYKLYKRLKLPRDPDDPDDPDLKGQARETAAREALEEARRLAYEFKEAGLACPDHPKAKNIAKRLLEWNENLYFTFLTDAGLAQDIGPTNNLAEQTVRAVVIDRHVTQGTRSPVGRERCERTWTVISSCAIQRRSAFDFIRDSIMAKLCGVGEAPSLIGENKTER